MTQEDLAYVIEGLGMLDDKAGHVDLARAALQRGDLAEALAQIAKVNKRELKWRAR